ncbi:MULTISPECIES: acetyl-CoA carboxylase biotin carboxyl carrier protein subunit [Bacillus]|jgi:acetyl-CoA carboxylase biotin carboxyl carrier protein|uniref:Biotin/lipoyl attachment protein n=5 Tax=Bacillus subtilis TaxID=1423 RepID=BLAP_BACSU|nr:MULTISPECIES: acetyl-CoA carboxylase biotin carboxyl carrier protein subunit [Bacillales]YP_003097733.1 methylcrotonyl-CoA carboxylase; biotinylated subunit (leucine degradation) [Bacillus subtilis subsp. subtilis str. 168]C0H419.1 RecName: Full=Biotin/lipoyl attachment protein; Short=BLAP [Bacillus subtilis subsp. subtilis str. 168]CJS01030.1 acetyl-CoA carboxylase biotin carboxyl carrier protein subunit [Streptococcus pneumoniae]BAM52478.1 acetyl-CoA carboxylase biotin carboxyl carrierprot
MTVSIQMAGNLWKVHVKAGDQIEKGQEVAILESMKMEIPIVADRSGIVKEVKKKEGDFVNEGDVLLELSNSTQ